MERQNSFQSVYSAGGGSESGSYYESGFYISSFAATVIIAGLLTMVISMITLVTILTVMLQSCQRQTSVVIESHKSYYNDDYCKISTLHMELNQLDTVELLPSVCRDYALSYISEGQFVRDLNYSISMAEKYFSSNWPSHIDFPVVFFDIDDILPSNFPYTKPLKSRSRRNCIEEAIYTRHMLMLRLYKRIQESGWPLILITRRAQIHQNAISKYLVSAGYSEWASLMMRSTDETKLNNLEYLLKRTAAFERQGYHISGVISSSLDALAAGVSMGKSVFKLPSLKFQHIESSNFC